MDCDDLSFSSDDETLILYYYYRYRKRRIQIYQTEHDTEQEAFRSKTRGINTTYENNCDKTIGKSNVPICTLNTKCRICNGNTAFIPILDNQEHPYLATDIYSFSGVQISDADNFSKYICQSCMNLLRECILFRDMCQKNDITLRTSISHAANKRIAKEKCHYRNKSVAADKNIPYIKTQRMVNMDYIRKGNSVSDYQNGIKSYDHPEMRISIDDHHDLNTATDNNDEGNEKSDESFYIPSPSFSDPETRSCNKCQKMFETLHSYESHLHLCEQGVTPPEKKELFLCDICGKTTTTKATLIFHKTIHFDVFPFKCDKCPYKGRTQNLLRLHYKSHMATSERTRKCSHCPKICYSKANLAMHVRRVHGNTERTHKCTLCEKMFKFKADLSRHVISIHTEKGNTQCEICFKIFRQKHLNKHMWRMHKIKTVKSDLPNRVPSYMLCSLSSEAAKQKTERSDESQQC